MLHNKKILLCVTGGIAVFKAVALTSKLTQAGAIVKVILSESAAKFVTPLTFQALSRNDVVTDIFAEKHAEKIAHIDLADWADLVLVAPATANTIGKLANGIADNMITTTIIATKAPVFLAPAMNTNMMENKAVVRNMNRLYEDGYYFLDSGEGYLACGYVGKGRMLEPEQIIAKLAGFFSHDDAQVLLGKKILITAGPTREKIDPVRYLSNFSSGKMGYALAINAVKMGAEVILISGPVELPAPKQVNMIMVESADEMFAAVMENFEFVDVVIGAAAVADYKPVYRTEKMKKTDEDRIIMELDKNKDILKTVGEAKTKQFVVGFAAETNHLAENAISKLNNKQADMIIANDVTMDGAGFGIDTNIVTIYQKNAEPIQLPLMTKDDVAKNVLIEISRRLP